VLGHDADWWNGAVVVALVLAIAAACAVAATTFAVITAQKREALVAKADFERYKASVALHVAEARNEGIEAGKAAAGADVKAAEAHKGAAEANARAAAAREKATEAEAHLGETKARAAEAEQHAAEARASAAEADARAAQMTERAAALEKEAATARLEQERLKASLAWRVLPPAQAAALEQRLASHPGSVNLWYTDGDPEALYLAIQFSKILENAKWKVLPAGANLSGIVFGIAAPDTTGADASALRAALHGAGIPFSTDPLPPVGFTIGATKGSGVPTLMIGSRPPAVFQ